jgi:hypothetical protein
MKWIRCASAVSMMLFLLTLQLSGWGFWAHREVARRAVPIVPFPLRLFFELHADSIIANAVEADRRKLRDSTEGPKHYIDIDHYGAFPFRELPRVNSALP